MPVTAPLGPPELPVDDGQAPEVLCGDEVVDVLVGLEQVLVQAAVLRDTTMHGGALRRVVRVEAQPVGVEDGDVLARPISAWAPVDVEDAVEVGGDVVLNGAHVQRSVPSGDEGLPANQRKLGWFLTKSGVEEQQQPGAGEGDGDDVLGGGRPAPWHQGHPGDQEWQLSIILRRKISHLP